MKSDLFDITLRLHVETDKAVLVSETGEKKDAVWLPKSLVELNARRAGRIVEITAPSWLLIEKGFV